jgi:ribose/xylose/arabinose/galactoside ABC-type transport system permease subunit
MQGPDLRSHVRESLPIWPAMGLILLLLFNLVVNPTFFSLSFQDGRMFGSLIDILHRGSIIAMLALGMTLVVASGGVDLSVGSVMAIAGAVVAVLLNQYQFSFWLAFPIALFLCSAVGLFNGLLVSFARVQPIVATLVLMVAGRGIAMLATDGQIVTLNNSTFIFLGNGAFLGVPFTVTLLLTMVVSILVVMRRTGLGLFLEALGDNEKAATYCGVNTRWVKASMYAVSGFCAGLAGLVSTANIKAADSSRIGELIELDAIFAVVVGGTALTGGRFTLIGSVIGALIIQSLTTTMYNFGVPSNIAPVPKAVIVLAICLLQSDLFRTAVLSVFQRRARA